MRRDRCPYRAFQAAAKPGTLALVGGVVVLLAGPILRSAEAQQSTPSAPPLVFDGVTVVDVDKGKLVPGQRVVIVGNRIQAVGGGQAVPVPKGAQVVDARTKYLIPGLWDMHIHPYYWAELYYANLVINGVTGMRDAWSNLPLSQLNQWRREILAGTRAGPPRQLLSGPGIGDKGGCFTAHACVEDAAAARQLVDSLKAAHADILKTYMITSPAVYFALAAQARRVGLPFGGHLFVGGLSAAQASDSGAGILDHTTYIGGLDTLCLKPRGTVERCRAIAERFRRNGTWWVPTWGRMSEGRPSGNARTRDIINRLDSRATVVWYGAASADSGPNFLRGAFSASVPDSMLSLTIVQQAGLPVMAGTDAIAGNLNSMPPGISLHAELALYVAEGMTALDALRSATLNPAKFLRATDSLGTVAPGKLADLVLLDADPLADITNVTMIRAVVANGRYFDRAGLDTLIARVQAKVRMNDLPPAPIK